MTLRFSEDMRMLRANAAPVSLRSSVQWQRKVMIGGPEKEMRFLPQRQDDCVMVSGEWWGWGLGTGFLR